MLNAQHNINYNNLDQCNTFILGTSPNSNTNSDLAAALIILLCVTIILIMLALIAVLLVVLIRNIQHSSLRQAEHK